MIWVFAIALLCSTLACPAIFRYLTRMGIYDVPKRRSVHRRQILRMGGLIFILAYLVAASCLPLLGEAVVEQNWHLSTGIIVCGVLMALLGSYDDYMDMRALNKFIFQWAIAAIAVSFGVSISRIGFMGMEFQLGFLDVPFTMFWIVGVTNAVNLLDGLDGLAGGTSLIALVVILALSPAVSHLSFLMVGLSAGLVVFLWHNAYPARIFMGDVGSLFLGFHLAVFSIQEIPWQNHFLGFSLPVLVMALPICDTLWAICRRLIEGRPPFAADRSHVHHRLLDLGFTQRQVTAILYAICAANGLLCALMMGSSGGTILVMCLAFGAIFELFCFPLTKSQRIRNFRYLKIYRNYKMRRL